MEFEKIVESIQNSEFITGIMLAIALCSVLVVAVLLERLVRLRRGRIVPRSFIDKVTQLVHGKQIKEAIAECDKSKSPVSNVVKAGLRRVGESRSDVEQAVMSAGAALTDDVRQHLELLDMIATASPLLGLLGTVVGMIQAFSNIAYGGSLGQPEVLAAGISNALITTAAGLTVAIPSLAVYHFAKRRGDHRIREVEAAIENMFGIHPSEIAHAAEEAAQVEN
ncbi:MAG: MotA/TolQ/ExbB proton channel family protein [Phycisphaerae bacterium]|jgi:biopolymer transport protein ExbB|nr:MotA/TolQ/ExbB proton channel family protein [Phycisphaerae bacterium]